MPIPSFRGKTGLPVPLQSNIISEGSAPCQGIVHKNTDFPFPLFSWTHKKFAPKLKTAKVGEKMNIPPGEGNFSIFPAYPIYWFFSLALADALPPSIGFPIFYHLILFCWLKKLKVSRSYSYIIYTSKWDVENLEKPGGPCYNNFGQSL